jgi:hypothetical protein
MKGWFAENFWVLTLGLGTILLLTALVFMLGLSNITLAAMAVVVLIWVIVFVVMAGSKKD